MQCDDELSFVDWRFPFLPPFFNSCFIPGANFEECHEGRETETEIDGL